MNGDPDQPIEPEPAGVSTRTVMRRRFKARFLSIRALATPWPTIVVVVIGIGLSWLGRTRHVFDPASYGDVGTWAAATATVSLIAVAVRQMEEAREDSQLRSGQLQAATDRERNLTHEARLLVLQRTILATDAALPAVRAVFGDYFAQGTRASVWTIEDFRKCVDRLTAAAEELQAAAVPVAYMRTVIHSAEELVGSSIYLGHILERAAREAPGVDRYTTPPEWMPPDVSSRVERVHELVRSLRSAIYEELKRVALVLDDRKA